MPSPAPANPNLRRRLLPGLLALAAAAPLRLLLLPLRKRPSRAPLLVFSSYMVGDLFMALPALKRLAAAVDVRVLCRPDCAGILEREGLAAIPFDNAFLTRKNPAALLRTLRAAWRLRRLAAGLALDFDADPRTALWLRIGGARRVLSYRRPFSVFFDETFAMPAVAIHQVDRDREVAEEFLRRHAGDVAAPAAVARTATPGTDTRAPSRTSPWILSVWTRKASKNWPLEHWNAFLGQLQDRGVPFAVLHAPDGDDAFQFFRARWAGRIAFIEGPLDEIAEEVRGAAGVIATDNFLGHMAGYYGKPVLWINIASPAAQVKPRGPRTLEVRAEKAGDAPAVEAAVRAFEQLRQ